MIQIVLNCSNCITPQATIKLDPADMNDWGWMIPNEIKEAGFECSETSVYCEACASGLKRGIFNMLLDEEKNGKEVELLVQINGYFCTKIYVPADISEEDVREATLAEEEVMKRMGSCPIRNFVYVPSKLVNILT